MNTTAIRLYILVETLIAIAIATCLSVGFAWIVFGGHTGLNLQAPEVVRDTAVQAFTVAFWVALPATILARRRVATGGVPRGPAFGRYLPSNVVLRALLVGSVVALCFGSLHKLFAIELPSHGLNTVQLLSLKGLFGAVVATVVAPLSVRAAIADLPPSRPARRDMWS